MFTHKMNITELHKIAGGLNIEGGFPAIDLTQAAPQKKWVNLVLILDRPLIDHIIFDDIIKNNKYPLLESAILEINEHQMLATYLMVINYYVASIDKPAKITVHIH